MQLRQIQADVTLLKGRVDKMALDNTMRSLINEEILPILEAFMEAVVDESREKTKEFNELEDAVYATLEGSEDIVTPETSAQLIHAFELGLAVCEIIDQEVKIENDLVNKKLRDAMGEFQRNAIASCAVVLESTVDPDEDDDEDEDEDEEVTPLEIPIPKKPKKEEIHARDDNDGDRDGDTTTDATAEAE